MSLQILKEREIIGKSGDPDLCIEVLTYSKKVLRTKKISMTETQWLSFVSHVSGMVYRSINMEAIPALEKEIFNEVSKDSIEMASDICKQLSNLHDDEKYLLSIHFETAKLN
ncbi:PRD domain-containing protein [Sporosarcina sp. ANT_H38]|uniref:PRD domain-containing protein n=1 Tax=Sporosarcina sp. ANT_H38 TaxID=2597358 RepID=UPI0011F17CC9|nr:PRD domain-containing protein [Sporosarcina sp. ANT_H38]KAA0966572.1 PRD domain-containing protein [Sporosarcina sp. ANT_H38]